MSQLPGVDAPEPPEGLAPTAGAALALIAASLALVGQFLLARTHLLRAGVASYLFAFAAFFWLAELRLIGAAQAQWERVLGPPWIEPDSGWRAFWRRRTWRVGEAVGLTRRAARHARRAVARAPLRAALILLAFALSAAVVAVLRYRADGALAYWDLLGLWLLAIALYLVAIIQPQAFLRRSWLATWPRAHRQVLLDAGLLWLAALVLRVPGLGQWPDVINGDEGIVGIMARGIATGGSAFGTDFAYGSLYYLIRSPLVVAFGSGIVQLRLVDAVGGALAAPAMYLAGRQLFGRRTGLIAGILLAALHMHIHLSRIALGHAVDATLTAVVIFTFMRGLDRRDAGWMALAGVGLGLSQYGYVGGRLLGLVFGVYVIALALVQPGYVARAWRLVATAFGAALITALPMIRWAIDRPGDYMARVEGVGYVQSGGLATAVELTGDSGWLVMARQVRDAFLSIVVYPANAFYEARIPLLNLGLAALFVLGLGYAVWRVRDRRNLLLVLEVVAALAVLALGQNATIAVYRVAGVMPVFILLAAMALQLLAEGALAGLGYRRWLPGVVMASVVAVLVTYDVSYYFGEHLPNCRYTDDRSAAVSVAAGYIGRLPPDTTVLALTRPYMLIGAYPSLEYLSRRQEHNLEPPNPDVPAPGEPGSAAHVYSVPDGTGDLASLVRRASQAAQSRGAGGGLVVIAVPERAGELDRLQSVLPGGERLKLEWCGGVGMEAYRLTLAVPAR